MSQQNEHRFPCDTCGADFRFDPGSDRLVCDHCGNVAEMENASPEIQELDFKQAIAEKLPSAEIEETRNLSCPNCAASFEFDADIHAHECPFCATPVVADTGTHRHIKPRGVLPFAIEERDAQKAMVDWLGGLWFAPNGLQEYARKGRKLTGIYAPYWTYDADTKSHYSGERGTHYYVTRTVMRDGKSVQVRERKTRWRRVTGRVARFFDDILVLGSRSLPKSHTDGLAPWQLSELQPYSPEYLAGFQAEGYVVSLTEGYEEARDYMIRIIRRDVRFDIGGDAQRIHNINTDTRDVTFKHILLPIWIAAYKYRGKSYRFVINGQSGRVQGERPYSAWKIGFAVLLGLSIAAGAGYLYARSQGAI